MSTAPVDYLEILLRLGTAVLMGAVIGLDRNLRGKPTGVRTLGLVALGAAVMTVTATNFVTADGHADASAVSRVIQGLVTGIGFLGAGVITHPQGSNQVRGLTTAASIWVTAGLGILCGIGSWQVALMTLTLVFLLFLLGKPLERALQRRFEGKPLDERKAMSENDE